VLHGSESGVNPLLRAREGRSVQALDAGTFLAVVDWTPVFVALIGMAGSVISAGIGAWVVYQLRTPSGMSIGKQVEAAHHVGLANHYRIRALASALGEPGEPDDPSTRKREAPDGA
jgi:hypothetical protein